jgi:hypothetical protein
MLISLCGIYGRDGNRWLQRFNGAWQVLLERLTGRIIAKKGSSDFGGKPSVHRHCERFLRSNLLSTGTEIASSRTALLAMTHVGDNNPAEPGRAQKKRKKSIPEGKRQLGRCINRH